jgi:hypothetical protein
MGEHRPRGSDGDQPFDLEDTIPVVLGEIPGESEVLPVESIVDDEDDPLGPGNRPLRTAP